MDHEHLMWEPHHLQLHETAQRILREAHELFFQKGYERTSMRDIAHRAGLSKATMYHHFEDKEHILYAICLKAGETMSARMHDAIARNESTSLSTKDQLTDILLAYTTTFLKFKNYLKILLQDVESLSDNKRSEIRKIEKAHWNRLRSYLHNLVNQGRLRPCNLTVLTFSVFSSMHWLYFWYLPQKPLSLREIIEHTVDILLYGTGARE